MPEYPVPGSSMIFELSRRAKEYFVKTIYNGVTYTICGGSAYCRFSDFRKFLLGRVHLQKGIFNECMNSQRSMVIINNNKKIITKDNWINGFLLLTFLVQILLVIITCSCCRKRRARKILTNTLEFEEKTAFAGKRNEKWSLNTEGDAEIDDGG